MKYKRNPYPDSQGDGIFWEYLYGVSKIINTTSYLLVCIHDLDASYERWEIMKCSKRTLNGEEYTHYGKTVVYDGREVPESFLDQLIDLVLEPEHLDLKILTEKEIIDISHASQYYDRY